MPLCRWMTCQSLSAIPQVSHTLFLLLLLPRHPGAKLTQTTVPSVSVRPLLSNRHVLFAFRCFQQLIRLIPVSQSSFPLQFQSLYIPHGRLKFLTDNPPDQTTSKQQFW